MAGTTGQKRTGAHGTVTNRKLVKPRRPKVSAACRSGRHHHCYSLNCSCRCPHGLIRG